MSLRKTVFFASALMLALIAVPRARAQSGTTYQNGRQLTCASDDGRRHYCPINTGRGVRLVNQRSGTPCVQGSTWGYDRRGVWVDRGCRADFLVDAGGGGWGGGGYPPPPPPPGNGWNGGGQVITCSSNNGGRNFCEAFTNRGVRLVNQRSGTPCVQGQTWGFNGRGIWVDRGCRADFALGR